MRAKESQAKAWATSRATWGWGAAFLAAVIVPALAQWMGSYYLVRIAGQVGLYMLLALGLNIVIGFTGLLDLGFMAFYALGAYTAALLAIHGWPFWLTLPAAMAVSTAFRLLLGLSVPRLRGDYLAIVTLGFGEITRLVLNNWDSLTNGPKGLPRVGETIAPPVLFGWPLADNLSIYYLILVAVAAGTLASLRLDRSRIGRAWVAIREDETAAELMGVPVTRVKLGAFAASAMFAGAAGAIFAHWERFVTPESFTFWESILLVSMVVMGGMGSVPGVLLGAVAMVAVKETLRAGLPASLIHAWMLPFSLALILIIRFRPEGLWPSRRRAMELH